MSTQIYDPNTLSMTPSAQAHIRRQIELEDSKALCLGIKESGCNGYMYELSYVQDKPENSTAYAFDEFTVYVSRENWKLVLGTEIDYVTEGLNSSLKFNNPNAETLCGCGESFSVTET